MGTLPHIRKLDDGLSFFIVRITCGHCQTTRELPPEVLARIAGWSASFEEIAPRLRCIRCGHRRAELMAVSVPRPRGIPKNPH